MIPQLDRSYFTLAREGAIPGTDAAYQRGHFRSRLLNAGLALLSPALLLGSVATMLSVRDGWTPNAWSPSKEIRDRALREIGPSVALAMLGMGLLAIAIAHWWPRKRWNDSLFTEIRRIFTHDPSAPSVVVQGDPDARQTLRYACAPYALVMEERDVLQLHGPDIPQVHVRLTREGTPLSVTVQDGRPSTRPVRRVDELDEGAQEHIRFFAATMLKLRSQHIG